WLDPRDRQPSRRRVERSRHRLRASCRALRRNRFCPLGPGDGTVAASRGAYGINPVALWVGLFYAALVVSRTAWRGVGSSADRCAAELWRCWLAVGLGCLRYQSPDLCGPYARFYFHLCLALDPDHP